MSKYGKQYYIDRAVKNGWGRVVRDDKYYDDTDLYDSFICFAHYTYAYLNLPAPSRAQIELLSFVSDQSNPHRMLQCLRGLSKSLSAQIYTVWRLLNDSDEHILVMSGNGDRARNFTQFVQKLLSLLPVCNGMQPRHNIERTSSQSFDVAGATASDSPSVYACGVGNQIAGMRATLVIYDDIETAQSSNSVVKRESIDHFASEAHNLLMAGKDETITLCTPHSMDSIYIKWIEQKGVKPLIIPAQYPEDLSIYNGFVAQYIVDAMQDDPSLVGTNIDERFTLDVLRGKEMRIGKSQYKLQYMLDTSASDEMKHPLKLSDLIVMDIDNDDAPLKISSSSMRENIVNVRHNGFKNDRFYSPSFVSNERGSYGHKVLCVDPSGSGSDETGIAVAFACAGKIHIKKITGIEGGYGISVIESIADMCKNFNIDVVVVEKNFGDGAYGKLLEPVLNRRSPKTSIDYVRAIGQKEIRIIRTIEPLLNQHKLVIDKKVLDDDLLAASTNNSFTYQLSHLSEVRGCLKHDDRLDALEMACSYLISKEDFDEEYEMERFEKDKLEEDLAKFMKDFKIKMNNRNNYAAKY